MPDGKKFNDFIKRHWGAPFAAIVAVFVARNTGELSWTNTLMIAIAVGLILGMLLNFISNKVFRK